MTHDNGTYAFPDFPDGFIFGAATSAYQIEGAADEDGRAPSIWDTFASRPCAVEGGENGAVACDHYHRLEQDLDLIRDLGLDAYRFSIAWPRVLPNGRGAVNQAGLDFYERLVDGLLKRGVEPHATLYHWDLPQALQDKGGWAERDTAKAFAAYAECVTRRLGDRVAVWTTLNEPYCSSILGHLEGTHAPGLRDPAIAVRAVHHLLLAHGLALPAVRINAPEARCGLVLNFTMGYPENDRPEAVRAARLFDLLNNRFFADPILAGRYPEDIGDLNLGGRLPVQAGDLEAICAPIDVLGVNYYTRSVLRAAVVGNSGPVFETVDADAWKTDMEWGVYPEGLTDLLVRLDRDYAPPPVIVYENGMARRDVVRDGAASDPERIAYTAAHLRALAAAMERGVRVDGYFAWSLMDNFEWSFGYGKRFGLVYVDYETLARTPKDSAKWYRNVLAERKRRRHVPGQPG